MHRLTVKILEIIHRVRSSKFPLIVEKKHIGICSMGNVLYDSMRRGEVGTYGLELEED